MRKYTVNNDDKPKAPSKETIEKYKDFSQLSHEYDRLTKRPKVPIYRDKRMFLVLLLILLVVYLVSNAQINGKANSKEEVEHPAEKVDEPRAD